MSTTTDVQASLRQKLAEHRAGEHVPAPVPAELTDAHVGTSRAAQSRVRIAEKLAARSPHDHNGRPVEVAPEVVQVGGTGGQAPGVEPQA